MHAVMDEGVVRQDVSKLRLVIGPSSAVYLFCAAMMGAALSLFLGTGEMLFLLLPVPFLAPVLPAAVASFRLACKPAGTALLEQGGAGRLPIAAGEGGGLEPRIDALGQLRTLPCQLAASGGLDGFFMARLRRS